MRLIHGDCLEEMKTIEDGSVDMVLTDPPYGTVSVVGEGNVTHGMKGKTDWDSTIEHTAMLEQCNRILRTNGALLLFGQDPYTGKLMADTHGNLPFSYRLTWVKDHFANPLSAKKAPVNYTEDICVFFKKYDTLAQHPLLPYFHAADEEAKRLGIKWRDVLGNGMASHYFTRGVQFAVPTSGNYTKLRATGLFSMSHEDIVRIDKTYRSNQRRVFNLPEGKKYKSNVLEYKKDYTGHHPTQKPVALMEDLIRTYTNEGDTVLDFTMGSGTTGVACKNLNRDFIGIELDEEYYMVAEKRIEDAVKAYTQKDWAVI